MEGPSDRDIIECTRMAGEALAWLDEKSWTNEDKVCVAAGVLPVLIARIAKDKAQFDKIRSYFLELIGKTGDIAWEAKLALPGE